MPQSAKIYSTTLYDAIELTARAHHGQVRKGTEIPYLVHPLAVAGILITAGCSEPLVIAGLLHDTLEDTPLTAEEIQSRFGRHVADLVEGLSEPDKSLPWEKRKAHTLEHLTHRATEEMLLISLADKLDNIRSLRDGLSTVGIDVWRRFNRPREKQAGYYGGLAAVFSKRLTAEPGRTLAQDFAAEVDRVFGAETA
jgi:(p)ppGpp synthase/HD superfamily hydrolase